MGKRISTASVDTVHEQASGSRSVVARTTEGPTSPGTQQGGPQHMQLVWQDGPDDDDMQRLFDAAHSRALVAFLRTPLGYEGLLGLKEPPCSISHPLLSELSQHPLGTHAELVREAVLRGLAGEMPEEGGRP